MVAGNPIHSLDVQTRKAKEKFYLATKTENDTQIVPAAAFQSQMGWLNATPGSPRGVTVILENKEPRGVAILPPGSCPRRPLFLPEIFTKIKKMK